MSTSRTIIGFVATLLMPFAIIGVGAGIVSLGLWLGWWWLAVTGGVIVLAGIVLAIFLFLAADAGAL